LADERCAAQGWSDLREQIFSNQKKMDITGSAS
jgi:hypothetical protein